MSQIPANTKLWNMLIAQAKTKFRVWPSAAASAWVHQHYVNMGGRFVESVKALNVKEKQGRSAEHEKEKKEEQEKGAKH